MPKTPANLTTLQRITRKLAKRKRSSIPTAKRLNKAMEALGKTVTAFEFRPDGSVMISVAEAKAAGAPNPWDEVFDHG